MGDKKEQEQSSEGAPNPWIYDVAKRHPEELPPGYNQSAERFYEQQLLMLPSQRSPLPGRWKRRRLLLWIAVFVLCLLIAAGILILSLIVR